jgi:hypothetical protein
LDDAKPMTCPVCDDPPYLSLNVRHAREHGDTKAREFVRTIERVRPIKHGHLCQCPLCDQQWVLDETESVIERVPRGREQIVQEWDSEQLPIAEDQLAILEQIGGTGADRYGNGRERIEIPCAVTLEDGTVHDPAIVWITKKPPIQDHFPDVRLFDHVRAVAPTEYALPLDVRLLTLAAHEIRMGFAPTAVQGPAGQEYVLNWSRSLFSYRGVKGNCIRPASDNLQFNESTPIVPPIEMTTVHFYADWFPRAERLDRGEETVSP